MGSAIKLFLSLVVGAFACAAVIAAAYSAIGHDRLVTFFWLTGAIPMIGPAIGLVAAVPVVLCVLAAGVMAGMGAYSLLERWWPTKPLGALGNIAIVTVFAVMLAAPFPARQFMQDRSFDEMCRTAETTFLRPPSQPVASIAHDWDPRWNRGTVANVHEASGMHHASAFFSAYGDDVEFVEFPDEGHKGIVRVPRGEYKGTPVAAMAADVLVRYDASDYELLQKAPVEQGPLKYSLIVTDRRDGQLLARMSYWLDFKGGRACGANNEREIDEAKFVRRAIRPL